MSLDKLQPFSNWLYATPVSVTLQSHDWIIPAMQTIHILSVAVLVGSAIVLDLKLAGFLAKTDPARVVFRRYMPWLWWALGILLATGAVQIIAEPYRAVGKWIFYVKMAIVLVAFLLTLVMRVPMLQAGPDGGDQPIVWQKMVKPLGIVSVLLWVACIFCGRWLAYSDSAF